MTALQQTSVVQFNSIVLSAEYFPDGIELANTVAEVEIQEKLFQPFLFGKLQFLDSMRVLEQFHGILGGEKLEIKLKRSESYGESTEINLNFRVVKAQAFKGADQFQSVELEFISEHMFMSDVKNVNQYYSGKPSKIIEKIASQYLDIEVDSDNSDRDEINVIVPNLSPVEAIDWVRSAAVTDKGYPLICTYSPFYDKIIIRDLGFILDAPAGNATPYVASRVSGTTGSTQANHRGLRSYQHIVSTGIQDLIHNGMVGSEYRYLQTNDTAAEYTWNIRKDFTEPAYENKILGGNNKDDSMFILNPFLEVDDELIEYNIANYHYVFGGSNNYRSTDNVDFELGYKERRTPADYKLARTAEILGRLIGMETLNFTINGVEYMQGDDRPTSVGNYINIQFPRSAETLEGGGSDISKSGHYLMLGCRHVFKREGYDMIVQGGRMARQEINV
mgnify:FL=1